MTKKEKILEMSLPLLLNKRIRIFCGLDGYWTTATVTGFTGLYLLLKDVEKWNGDKKDKESINSKWITKIEMIK